MQLPWPDSTSFEVAKVGIQNRAKEIWNLPQQISKIRRDRYAAEFLSNNKDWIPKDRQAWASSCVSRVMARAISGISRGQTSSAAIHVANGSSDNNQPTPPPNISNNDHENGDHDNTHEGNNHGDDDHRDSNHEYSIRSNNETTATTDNVPCYTRSTRVVGVNLDDDDEDDDLSEAHTVDDKFGSEALKNYNIRLNHFVDGNLQTTKRVLLWLCGSSEATTRCSAFDIGHLSFEKLAKMATLSENETITYAYTRSPTGYMQIMC